MKVLLAHPGTQHSYHLARELDRRGCLTSFYTGVAFRPGCLLTKIVRNLSPTYRKRFANRTLHAGFSAELYRRGRIELMAQWRLRQGTDEQEVMHQRNEAFQLSVPDKALRKANAVIGVDTASWILAERSQMSSRICSQSVRLFNISVIT